MEIPIDIKERLELDFGVKAKEVILLINEAILKHHYLNNDRVIRCIIYLGKKSVERLQQSIKMAINDPRDLILNAEYEPSGEGNNFEQVRDFNQPFIIV